MRGHRFTIYDALEKSGYFDINPANSFARDLTTGDSLYLGPQPYPKMLYHPEGEEKIVVAAEVISTPMGPKEVGEQRELLYLIVANQKEEELAAAEGWWDHPAKSVRKRVELYIERTPHLTDKEKKKVLATIPPISIATSNQDRIRELERQVAEFEKQKAGEVAEPATTKPSPGAPLQPAAMASSLGARFTPEPLKASPPAAS